MQIPWLISLFCAIGGVFGAFGVAHYTRLRKSAFFFYLLAVAYMGHAIAIIKGLMWTSMIFHDGIICLSALALLVYAFTVERYWKMRKSNNVT